mgnify:CR=1 FL=1
MSGPATCTGTATSVPAICTGNATHVPAVCTGVATDAYIDCALAFLIAGDGLGASCVDGCSYTAAFTPTCDLNISTDNTTACPAGCHFEAEYTPSCDLHDGTDDTADCLPGCDFTTEATIHRAACEAAGQCSYTEGRPSQLPAVQESCLPTCESLQVSAANVTASCTGVATDSVATPNCAAAFGETIDAARQACEARCPHDRCDCPVSPGWRSDCPAGCDYALASPCEPSCSFMQPSETCEELWSEANGTASADCPDGCWYFPAIPQWRVQRPLQFEAIDDNRDEGERSRPFAQIAACPACLPCLCCLLAAHSNGRGPGNRMRVMREHCVNPRRWASDLTSCFLSPHLSPYDATADTAPFDHR